MNIITEKINELNSIVKVKLSPEDYQQLVDSKLKEIQRKASMPGFRPGKVPVGMVKKMYGKSVLADEINKVLNKSLTEYISSNRIDILGQPIPSEETQDQIDWDNQQDFEFSFDLGHAPEFSLDLNNESFEYKIIKIEEDLIDKEIADMQRRYGKISNPEKVEKNDLIFGVFKELDSEGNELENGITKSASIATDKIKDEKTLNALLGQGKDFELIVDPHLLSDNQADVAAMLGISAAQAESLSSNFKFTISNISRVEPAELNEELFNKIYGESIQSIEAFRDKIKSELSGMFNSDSDKFFLNKVVEALVKRYDLQLPEGFLKRWLLLTNDTKLTAEQIEREFPVYAERLKTQILVNKILKENQISVSDQEIRAYVKDLIAKQFASYNMTTMEEKDLEDTVSRVLKNDKEYNRILEKMYDDRILAFLKSKLKLNFTEVSFEDFYHQH
jgi:trigger factor